MRKTKKEYVEHLNAIQPEQGSGLWIIGGAIRMYLMWRRQYGQALRKHDPIAFEVGYNEWKKCKS